MRGCLTLDCFNWFYSTNPIFTREIYFYGWIVIDRQNDVLSQSHPGGKSRGVRFVVVGRPPGVTIQVRTDYALFWYFFFKTLFCIFFPFVFIDLHKYFEKAFRRIETDHQNINNFYVLHRPHRMRRQHFLFIVGRTKLIL